MESCRRDLDTANGRITIFGELLNLEDLSFGDLQSSLHQDYERGYALLSFSKPSMDVISKQYKLLNDLFSQEKYQRISGGKSSQTMNLNRYCDILVYERNAVRLPEFINASYVNGVLDPGQRGQFIATQGPMPATLASFWKMAWVHNCSSIFMLCGPAECQSGKCEIYWPHLGSSITIGDFRIKNLAETRKSGHIIRTLEVKSSEETRTFLHYHYVSWPDHGVPRELQTLGALLDDLLAEERKNRQIIVHCSAGIGRTGTLLALSHLKQTVDAQKNGNEDSRISVFSVVRRLREQRCFMVQSREQFEILYDFVCQWVR